VLTDHFAEVCEVSMSWRHNVGQTYTLRHGCEVFIALVETDSD
jgi:hypothetical protein